MRRRKEMGVDLIGKHLTASNSVLGRQRELSASRIESSSCKRLYLLFSVAIVSSSSLEEDRGCQFHDQRLQGSCGWPPTLLFGKEKRWVVSKSFLCHLQRGSVL